jgi:hypothetical protein
MKQGELIPSVAIDQISLLQSMRIGSVVSKMGTREAKQYSSSSPLLFENTVMQNMLAIYIFDDDMK